MTRRIAANLLMLLVLCGSLPAAAQTSQPASGNPGAITPADGPRLAGFADGAWKGVNAVYQCPQFVATLGTNLVLEIQPVQNGTNTGSAITVRFGASYTDPKLANKRHQTVPRRVVSLSMPPKPTLRASAIHITGTLEDDVGFDYQLAFSGNKVTAQCKFKDPPKQAYRTSFAIVAVVDPSRVPSPTLKLEELALLMPDWLLKIIQSDGKRLEVPYHRSIGLEAGQLSARELEIFGPWDKRRVSITSEGEDKKDARNSQFRHYPGYAPFHGYHMVWHLRDGDIKRRGFTIEVQ